MTTLKRTKGIYFVTVNGEHYAFASIKDALHFIMFKK